MQGDRDSDITGEKIAPRNDQDAGALGAELAERRDEPRALVELASASRQCLRALRRR